MVSTQSCRRLSQTECWGAGQSESANDPTATAIRFGKPSASQYTVEPQIGQNRNVTQRPWSDCRVNSVALPEIVGICCRSNHAWLPNTALCAADTQGNCTSKPVQVGPHRRAVLSTAASGATDHCQPLSIRWRRFRKRPCYKSGLEREDDSKKSHRALSGEEQSDAADRCAYSRYKRCIDALPF